jgi:hypothetical protein
MKHVSNFRILHESFWVRNALSSYVQLTITPLQEFQCMHMDVAEKFYHTVQHEKKFVSDNTTKQKHQFLVKLPS